MIPFKPDERGQQSIPEMHSFPPATFAPAPYSQPASTMSGGQAASSEESAQQGQVINYYFPIEVDVLGALDEAEVQRIARYVYDELLTALQSQIPRVE
ncbi:MAG TPA: hypothetical protein VKX46_08295 [Ktedonobacteraceae bacterium]|nr:hypothetical protein [Ktedonobacteraceae bacterium]